MELDLALKFKVQSEISIAAGCNQQGDHNILGELIYELSKITSGLIDFGYDILKYNLGDRQNLKGVIYSIESGQQMSVNHIVDSEFFGEWLSNNKDNLRMVK